MQRHLAAAILLAALAAPLAWGGPPANGQGPPGEGAEQALLRRISAPQAELPARRGAVLALWTIGSAEARAAVARSLATEPALLPEPHTVIGLGRRAVLPLLELWWSHVRREEAGVLLRCLDPDEVLEVCLELAADYHAAPELRLRAGDFALGLAGLEALREPQERLWRDLLKEPAAPHDLRRESGRRIDALIDGKAVDPTVQSSFEYRRLSGEAGRNGPRSWFIDGAAYASLLRHAMSPTSPLAGEAAAFLDRIEFLKGPSGRGAAGAVPPEVGERLVFAAAAKDPALRRVAARHLPWLQEEAAGDSLLKLTRDPEVEVRALAVAGLGHLPIDRAGAALERIAADEGEDQRVRAAAAGALARGAARAGGDAGAKRELGEDEILSLLRRIAAESNPALLDSQLVPLADLGPETVGRLSRHLSHEELPLRAAAALALGATGAEAAVAPLLHAAALEPGDRRGTRALEEKARCAAIEALGRLGDPEALPTLSRMYLPTMEPEPLSRLAVTLARLDAEEALPLLEAAAASDVAAFRQSAADGLSELPNALSGGPLLELIDRPATRDVGLVALYSQAHRGALAPEDLDGDAVELLTGLVTDEDPCTAIFAGAVLVALGRTDPFLEWLDDEDLEEIAARPEVYIMMGREGSEEMLVAAFRDEPDAETCIQFKESGSWPLVSAGREWGSENALEISRAGNGPACTVKWGTTEVARAGGVLPSPR